MVLQAQPEGGGLARSLRFPPLQGGDAAAGAAKVRSAFWPALQMNWRVWTPVQFINVNYVPLQVRPPARCRTTGHQPPPKAISHQSGFPSCNNKLCFLEPWCHPGSGILKVWIRGQSTAAGLLSGCSHSCICHATFIKRPSPGTSCGFPRDEASQVVAEHTQQHAGAEQQPGGVTSVTESHTSVGRGLVQVGCTNADENTR